LLHTGHTHFIETSPHPVLTTPIQQTADTTDTAVATIATLRRNHGGPSQLATALAQGRIAGLPVAGTPYTGPRPPLPAYPFQHAPYWLHPAATGTGALGQTGTDHPLVVSAVELADGQGHILTGQVSTTGLPWLADHAVHGTVLLSSTTYLETALRSGLEVGCGHVEDLTLEVPLVLSDGEAVQLQAVVGEPDAEGRRSFAVYSRPTDASGDTPWTRRAGGSLTAEAPTTAPTAAPPQSAAWPPAGAVAIDLTDAYERLSARGYDYGPAFQGLRAAWRLGDDVYATVALPDSEQPAAQRFCLHPALLDAALHPIALGLLGDHPESVLPFSWSGVSLHAVGADGVRVRLSPAGTGSVAITVTDTTGAPVADIASLALRPVDPARLRTGADPGLPFLVEWSPVDVPGATQPATGAADVLVVRPEGDTTTPHDPIAAAHLIAEQTLARVQEWLAEDRADDAHLVVVTRGAVSTGRTDPITDLPAATTWGLIRTAQNEHPHTFTLLDHHGDTPDPDTITAALTTGQPQLALRNGNFLTPRLTPTTPNPNPTAPTLDPNGTILITGGTGTLAT
ncbi:polyketide synthase dehydratase domain-containing protein, partial [Kitasatospora sp. NPDC098652]|uniref:polyketide synthase dehydratase domain-containing protein n=1 Tax=Kitasatospora sp. NPDC098652 TaxID=3364095 RepID=UPI00381C4718